jgi:hypothetical protein
MNLLSVNCGHLLALADGVGALNFQRAEGELLISGDELDKALQQRARELQMTKEVKIKWVVSSNEMISEVASAHGNDLLPGPCGVIIDRSKFQSTDQMIGILSHEFAHIKNNDRLSIPLVGIVSSTISQAILRRLFRKFKFTNLTALAVGGITSALFSQHRELEADRAALEVCHLAERQAMAEFYKNIRDSQVAYRNEEGIGEIESLKRCFLITSEGDLRLDFSHPSWNARIQVIEEYNAAHPS